MSEGAKLAIRMSGFGVVWFALFGVYLAGLQPEPIAPPRAVIALRR